MVGIYYLIGAIAAVAVLSVGLLLHFKAPKHINIFLKTVSLALATALLVRYMLGQEYISSVVNLQSEGFSSKSLVAFALVQVWFMYAAEMLVILASFFKVKSLPALVSTFAAAVFIMNFALLGNHITAIVGAEGLETFSVRALFLAAETGLGLGYAGVYAFEHYKEIVLKKWEWLWFALAIIGMVFAAMPSYAFQVVLEPRVFFPKDFNYYHRLLLYPAAIVPVALYLLVKGREEGTRRFVLLFYAWTGLLTFSFDHRFGDLFGANWAAAWPLQLCGMMMYLIPLCLTFRWKKPFAFAYFIGVLGAVLAMAIPNYGNAAVYDTQVWLFYMSHYQVFFMPLLAVGFGVFSRPGRKEFFFSLIAFAIYFIVALAVGAWFNNYSAGVDYLYLHSSIVADRLGSWAVSIRNITWRFDVGSMHFEFHLLYQFLILVVYAALAFGMYFLYDIAFKAVAGWRDIAVRDKKVRMDKLALAVKLGGSIEEPLNAENCDKLVLKGLTKRYGNSTVYAVKDANLEVRGGEIYGFLGPNGAGKSSIIKSIVGIHPITGGAIEVCGYDVATQSVQAKRQIGFVPDHYALYERLTAREYINYIADLYGVSREDRATRIDRFVEMFEFHAAIDNAIRTYSHGMKQKVAIMAALIHNPKVWILDEPLTGLDPNSIFQVKECMKQHAAAGNIVFFSSHLIDIVERVCDRIAIIRKGQIQCVRDLHEMEANGENLEQFYMSVISDSEVEPIPVETAEEVI